MSGAKDPRHLQIALKKYVVRLSVEERQTLESLIDKGKHPASPLLKARILLTADISDAGEGWSDQRIVAALDSCLTTVHRTRQRKTSPIPPDTPARRRDAARSRPKSSRKTAQQPQLSPGSPSHLAIEPRSEFD